MLNTNSSYPANLHAYSPIPHLSSSHLASSFITNFRIPLPERKRGGEQGGEPEREHPVVERGRSQNPGTLWRRNSSRDRSRERVGIAPQRQGTIPKEGEQLLERLTVSEFHLISFTLGTTNVSWRILYFLKFCRWLLEQKFMQNG